MTNAEWLESKINNFAQKFWDWIYKHIWVPIVVLALFIGVIVYVTIFIEKAFVVFLFPLGMFEFVFIGVAVCQWLDKEHKEK